VYIRDIYLLVYICDENVFVMSTCWWLPNPSWFQDAANDLVAAWLVSGCSQEKAWLL
jgi:hypothetical protein